MTILEIIAYTSIGAAALLIGSAILMAGAIFVLNRGQTHT